jgi:sulfatase maturation enzyme AslB (radical SAM superfamily)
MKPRPLTLYACSPCNLACQECIMQHQMHMDPHYHLSLDDVANLCQLAEKNKYLFDVTLSGGEPLLWKYLNEALHILGHSPAVRRVIMFTNAIPHARLTKKAAWHCNSIRISDYGYNAEAIAQMKLLYPQRVGVMNRTAFWRNPRYPYPPETAFPVQCMNPEIMLYNGRIYACPHCLSIAQVLAEPPKPEQLSVPLAGMFLDQMDRLKETYHQQLCTRCISNKSIRDTIGIPDINVSRDKRPELHQIGEHREEAKDRWLASKDKV